MFGKEPELLSMLIPRRTGCILVTWLSATFPFSRYDRGCTLRFRRCTVFSSTWTSHTVWSSSLLYSNWCHISPIVSSGGHLIGNHFWSVLLHPARHHLSLSVFLHYKSTPEGACIFYHCFLSLYSSISLRSNSQSWLDSFTNSWSEILASSINILCL